MGTNRDKKTGKSDGTEIAQGGKGSGEDSNPKSGKKAGARTSCEQELATLLELGKRLDDVTPDRGRFREPDSAISFPLDELDTSRAWKPTQRDAWIEEFLFIRSKIGEPKLIELNRVQREYARVCLVEKSHKNIVLKARQVGITSYIARGFLCRR